MDIIAHRGASGEFPENTLLAFEQAIIQQANAIELDVHYHHESREYIVFHDAFIGNQSGHKSAIQQLDFQALSSCQLGFDQTIPTLLEALAKIHAKVPVNIELKSSSTDSDLIDLELDYLYKTIQQSQANYRYTPSQIIISSFNHILLSHCQRRFPQYKYGALIAHIPLQQSHILGKLDVNYLNIAIDTLNESTVNYAKTLGLKVGVYTVDERYDIGRCYALGVDAIFTNYPKRTRNIVQEF